MDIIIYRSLEWNIWNNPIFVWIVKQFEKDKIVASVNMFILNVIELNDSK